MSVTTLHGAQFDGRFTVTTDDAEFKLYVGNPGGGASPALDVLYLAAGITPEDDPAARIRGGVVGVAEFEYTSNVVTTYGLLPFAGFEPPILWRLDRATYNALTEALA